MARRPDANESSDAGKQDHIGSKDGASEGGYRRRGYLKLVGSTAAAAAAIGSSATAAAADYDTVTVGQGERRTISLGDGDTLEDTLFDVSAQGANLFIRASGSDWTIRNVGVKGSFDRDANDGQVMRCDVPSSSGEALIENVYLADGVGEDTNKTAINVGPDHAGHIECRNLAVARWSSNAIYAAGFGRIREPGTTDGAGGTIAFRNSYFCNNNIAHLRLAADGTEVENCVFENTSDVPPIPTSHGGGSDVVNSRGIYTGYGDPSQTITVKNCDFNITSSNTNGAASVAISGNHATYGELTTVRLVDCQTQGRIVGDNVETENVGNSPDTTPPDAAPMTPEEAASGGGTSGNSDGSGNTTSSDPQTDLSNTITVSGGSATNLVEYEFTVSEDLEAYEGITAEDTIDGTTAQGGVAGGADTYAFAGEVTDFSSTEDVAVTINGQSVDTAELSDSSGSDGSSSDGSTDSSGDELSRTLRIAGGSPSNIVEYRLDVSDALGEHEGINEDDVITGTGAEGTVAGGADTYAFAGEVTGFEATDDVSVTVDGETLDQTQFGPVGDSGPSDGSTDDSTSDGSTDSSTEKLLLVDGTANPDENSRYRFTVSGTAAKDQERSTVSDGGMPWDSISDSVNDDQIIGIVGNGVDAYRFTGELETIDIRGDATHSVEQL